MDPSDVGLPGAVGTPLWLDTRECIDDGPPPATLQRAATIRALWEIDEKTFYIDCWISNGFSPNGKRWCCQDKICSFYFSAIPCHRAIKKARKFSWSWLISGSEQFSFQA